LLFRMPEFRLPEFTRNIMLSVLRPRRRVPEELLILFSSLIFVGTSSDFDMEKN
jgi:hypothetical protein